jgi:bacteriocin-like protein
MATEDPKNSEDKNTLEELTEKQLDNVAGGAEPVNGKRDPLRPVEPING